MENKMLWLNLKDRFYTYMHINYANSARGKNDKLDILISLLTVIISDMKYISKLCFYIINK